MGNKMSISKTSPASQIENEKLLPLPVTVLGLGLLLTASEGERMASLRTVSDLDFFVALTAFVCLLLLALLYRIHVGGTGRLTALICCVGLLMSAALFSSFESSPFMDSPVVLFISHVATSICAGILLFFWVQALYPLGPKTMVIIYAMSIITLAVISSLIAALDNRLAQAVVSISPLLSTLLLLYFCKQRETCPRSDSDATIRHTSKRRLDTVFALNSIDSTKAQSLDSTRDNQEGNDRKAVRNFALSILIPLCCYSLIFGSIHNKWITLQDGSITSLMIHLGTELGSALGGLVILMLAFFFWSERALEQYKMVLLPLVILALWLSSFVATTWVFTYLIVLNISHKMVFLLLMLCPFMVGAKQLPLLAWCMAYLSDFFGKLLGALVLPLPVPYINVIAPLIALLAIFASSIALPLLSKDASLSSSLSKTKPQEENQRESVHRFRKAVLELGKENRLTERETEVVALLARGRTARHIADSLIISEKTAKTHLRNIYAKLGIHTQQELLTMIEKSIDSQKYENNQM
jgi:DNA-binding CsgD family transcriptional regulator